MWHSPPANRSGGHGGLPDYPFRQTRSWLWFGLSSRASRTQLGLQTFFPQPREPGENTRAVGVCAGLRVSRWWLWRVDGAECKCRQACVQAGLGVAGCGRLQDWGQLAWTDVGDWRLGDLKGIPTLGRDKIWVLLPVCCPMNPVLGSCTLATSSLWMPVGLGSPMPKGTLPGSWFLAPATSMWPHKG